MSENRLSERCLSKRTSETEVLRSPLVIEQVEMLLQQGRAGAMVKCSIHPVKIGNYFLQQ